MNKDIRDIFIAVARWATAIFFLLDLPTFIVLWARGYISASGLWIIVRLLTHVVLFPAFMGIVIAGIWVGLPLLLSFIGRVVEAVGRILEALGVYAAVATIVAYSPFGLFPAYVIRLVGVYLVKRRIAWVSLVAVMLCTTMVLVVISVMGGWLKMFKSSFRGLSGDIVIHSDSMQGFPYYAQIIDKLKENNDIAAAAPTIETYGLINFGKVATLPAKVMGMPIAEIGKVNSFADSLYLQHVAIVEKLKNPKLPADQRAALERKLHEPPSFDLLDEVSAPLASLPNGLKYEPSTDERETRAGTIKLPDDAPDDLQGRLRYDSLRKNLLFRGPMKNEWKPLLAALSTDGPYQKALDALQLESRSAELIDYTHLARGRATGMIAGSGVIQIGRNREGEWEGREAWKYTTPMALTVLNISGGGTVSIHDKITRTYFLVDDSRTQVWQYDNNYVYVPFDRLQKDLGLDTQTTTDIDGRPITIPGRATDIHIKVRPGIDPNDEKALDAVAAAVRANVHDIMAEQRQAAGEFYLGPDPKVETWQETQRIWINAVENEKLLTVVLFGIISVVAIFLVFCIFYMIVVEKTRDIGIIKSVGATSGGIIGIFLGYGLAIGIVGSGMGLLLSYCIVHWINELHNWLGYLLHIKIWNPEVYLFDKIPNEMSAVDIAVIIPIAIVSSVLGALVPAIRAGRMNPVESLRWE